MTTTSTIWCDLHGRPHPPGMPACDREPAPDPEPPEDEPERPGPRSKRERVRGWLGWDRRGSGLQARLTQVAADMVHVVRGVVDGDREVPAIDVAVRAMRADQPGQPGAQALDGAGGRPAPGSRPPGGWGQPNRGGADLDEVREIARRMERDGRRLRALVDAWTPHAPSESARRAVEREGEPGCERCQSLFRRWEPVYRRGTVGGSLKVPMALCRWCYDWTLEFSELPPKSLLLDHHEGRRVARPAKAS